MHRIDSGTYVGQPGELVTLVTHVDGGGQITVTLDGQPLAGSTFSLPANAGGQSQLQIALFGPVGAACVVNIAVVDGASDADLLLCQPHDPAPVHFLLFLVASAGAITALAAVKDVAVAPAAPARTTPPAAPQAPRKPKGRRP